MTNEIAALVKLLAADAARYRYLSDQMVHVSHPDGDGWTLDVVIASGDQDLDAVIDAEIAAREAKWKRL